MTPSAMIERSSALASVLLRTTDAGQTRELGAVLASVAQRGDRLGLIGPLGAGKTQFAKGFAAGLGVLGVVGSPSFTLMAEYDGRLPLFHQDLYRLSGATEIIEAGLLDERQESGVTVTEWADRLEPAFDVGRLDLHLTVLGDDEREIALRTSVTERYSAYLAAARRWEAAGRRP